MAARRSSRIAPPVPADPELLVQEQCERISTWFQERHPERLEQWKAAERDLLRRGARCPPAVAVVLNAFMIAFTQHTPGPAWWTQRWARPRRELHPIGRSTHSDKLGGRMAARSEGGVIPCAIQAVRADRAEHPAWPRIDTASGAQAFAARRRCARAAAAVAKAQQRLDQAVAAHPALLVELGHHRPDR